MQGAITWMSPCIFVLAAESSGKRSLHNINPSRLKWIDHILTSCIVVTVIDGGHKRE